MPEKFLPLNREEKFLLKLNLKGKHVYDIGGYEGLMTIFFARSVGNMGKVVAYEPNPTNCQKLIENVKINEFDNVEIRQMGIGGREERLELAFDPRDLGRSSFRSDYFKKRNIKIKGENKIRVDIDSLDNQINKYNLPIPDFIKIDVEEYEMDVLCGMKETVRKWKPHLFIEMHGSSENVSNVVRVLRAYEYSIIHVEGNVRIDSSKVGIVRGGDHLYCI